MKQFKTTRKSHCSVCGRRLSEKAASGIVSWQRCHVDDSGIYCKGCHARKSVPSQKSTPK